MRSKTTQHPPQKSQSHQKGKNDPRTNRAFSIILIAYGLLPVITPSMGSWDTNGSKFFFMSLFNILTFLYLFNRKEIKRDTGTQLFFFRSWTGFLYSLFMIISLLSFVKSINMGESLITFAKFFTIFMAAYIVSIVVRTDRKAIYHLCVAMVLLLIIDSIVVFFNVLAYVNGSIPSISAIKSIYSNKNILTSAIFIKIPFALWLISYGDKRMKNLSLAGVFLAVTAIFFLSTRAFYIGIILIFILYLAFMIIRWKREKSKAGVRLMLLFAASIILGLLVYSSVQVLVFSKLKQEDYNSGIANRLSSVSKEIGRESGGRIVPWKMTGKLIKENPVLGVGLGNWKISVLKYESLIPEEGFVFYHETHDDFLQVTSETGIIGGLIYLAVFILTAIGFLRAFFKKQAEEESYKYLLIPAFGIFSYSIDASFNFPFDRPEIVAFFALFVGFGIGLTRGPVLFKKADAESTKGSPLRNSVSTRIIAFSLVILSLAGTWFLYMNFKSQQIQKKVAGDLLSKQFTLSYAMLADEFPAIPSVNSVDEPVAVLKARYLINEGKYADAITLLKNDRSSPYYAKVDYFIAMAYDSLGQQDSALVHYTRSYQIKPHNFVNIQGLSLIYMSKGDTLKAKKLTGEFLDKIKGNPDAWGFAAYIYERSGEIDSAFSFLVRGTQYCPGDTNLQREKESMGRWANTRPYTDLYNQAIYAYRDANYEDAYKKFTDFISKMPNFLEAYEYRASCLFMMKEYRKSLEDIKRLFALGEKKAMIYTLRGANFHELGDNEAACKDFQIAMKMGDSQAADNYQRYCANSK
jgi:putative inorganic carbon (hco3(-)) transporter